MEKKMDKGKKNSGRCICPPQNRTVCKHARNFDCKDVSEIVDALSLGYGGRQGKKKDVRVPHFKPKAKCRRYGDAVPMQPPLEDRKLLYTGVNFEGADYYERCLPYIGASQTTIGTKDEKEMAEEQRRRLLCVRHDDLQATDVRLDAPLPVVTHTATTCDLQCLYSVPSPKISGEVIPVARAALKPVDARPPLPASSGVKLPPPARAEQCSICLKQFKSRTKVKQLPCGHLFHGICILTWLDRTNSCPFCRYELPTDHEGYDTFKKEKKKIEQRKEDLDLLHNIIQTQRLLNLTN